jgi:hypothetical protein
MIKELFEFHKFANSIEWKLTKEGLFIKGSGIERTKGRPLTIMKIWTNFSKFINEFADKYAVPAELIIATIATESGGKVNAIRKERNYISDEATPHRISVGLMQTLISTASDVMGFEVDRAWLLVPENSIHAGTKVIKNQERITLFDPPKVAAAYNAGSIYYDASKKNRWKMRQFPLGTSKHVDKFIRFFNDFIFLCKSENLKLSYSFFLNAWE